jgi:DNA repair protein RecN (Recombination protein N)
MLTELRVRNYAVIDDVRVELGAGLNVLTGETGAGKSILVDALSLLLGERASTDAIRSGEDRAAIEGAFDVSDMAGLRERAEELGVNLGGGWLILRRELQRQGRNRAWANDSPATAGLVGELGGRLVDLHGQHEHQALLRPDAQRRMLDAFGGSENAAAAVRRAWEHLRDLEVRIASVRARVEEAGQRADFLAFKAREIESAGLRPDEEERLGSEARRLESSEDLLALSGELYEAVYAGEDAVVDRLGALRRSLDELIRIDAAGAGSFGELFESALVSLEELGRLLADYHHSVEHDPERLAEIRERLDHLRRLRRKYGGDLAAVIEEGRRAREELDALDRSDREIRGLEAEAEAARTELGERAERLGAARRTAAKRLDERVTALLGELGMPGGIFRVRIETLPEPGPRGAERIEFLVSPNPGFEPGPLARVASGGELSRVMLALKTVLAAVDDVPCLVFDEIDAGVGGRVAHQVAARLADVARAHQVLAVTHLPQIAARAHLHFRVDKVESGGLAATRIVRLEGEDRVEELARMLGGDPESPTARRHAEELLTGAAGP